MKEDLTKFLLACGSIAALLYVATDITLAVRWQGYSYINQSISELSAIGAPTRHIWIVMSFFFNPLFVAFGIGILKAAGTRRSVRITGILLTLWGALGFVWLLFPMHMRGAIGSATDTMHFVMTGVALPLMLLFIIFGSVDQARWFRFFSILTILAMLVFGALVSGQLPLLRAQLPTPWMGVMERICVYSPMLWLLVLAVILLRQKRPLETQYNN